MAASTPSTIILKGQELVIYNEFQTAGTITPGMLVAVGSAGTVNVHASAGGSSPGSMFAVEDDAQGRSITDDYGTATYKTVRVAVCNRGVEVYAILYTNQTAVIGSALESAGDGTLRVLIQQSNVPAQTSPLTGIRTGQVVAHATEAVTTTSATARIKVRVA